MKKLRRYFSEDDIIENITAFIRLGLRKGERVLTSELFGEVTIVIVKCRIRKHRAVGRYLRGAYIDDEDPVYTFTVRKSIPEERKAYVGFRCAK